MKRLVLWLGLCILPCQALLADEPVHTSHWQAPFEASEGRALQYDSSLTLHAVLGLVAGTNPTLRALEDRRQAARGQLTQAGLWPNPELEAEVEEFGWDAPGLSESELTIAVSQELELFGQRGARQDLARTEIAATDFATDVGAFDLYLEVKRRFYTLAHAQDRLRLSEASVNLADSIVENISFRIEKGAGLQSELLLARIEQQRARLALEQQRQHRLAAEARLVALWDGPSEGTTVAYETEPDLDGLLQTVMSLPDAIDSTRQIRQLQKRAAILRAQHSLAVAEAHPALTLSAGMKRFEAANSQSFLFGVSLPLPLFDRNQGTRTSLDIEARSVDHQIARERLDTKAAIRAHILELRNLIERHDTLDLRLLPTAEEAYRSLQDAYEAGRLPYTQLLEAERSLNQLRFEHIDILLALHQRVIDLESLTGAVIRIDKEE